LGVVTGAASQTLYAGGDFATLQTQVVNGIACHGPPWQPLCDAPPTIAVLQAGSGAPATLANGNLRPGDLHFNLYSVETTGSLGFGGFLGLYVTSPASFSSIIGQIISQTPPFTFTATSSTHSFGPFPLPAGLTLDLVAFRFPLFPITCVTPVLRHTF
jgi:hypothetical protein